MTTKVKTTITEAEWEVMRVAWTAETVTSKEIVAVLKDKMNWKPATIKTLIGRLVEKGLLATEPVGNKFIYTPTVSEEDSVKNVTLDVFSQMCNKKVGTTLANLLAEATLSHEDVRLLEEVLAQKKKEAVDEVACNCAPGQCNC
ncbi:MAG: CopY/TcrY family copper transport repressor [Carnobacterium sp.]|uniref:CopY/TcrY family copper transport repressor n=1 Tax=Carnobacterium antarcticum TaxID=2126436 RepID=A0ABW4NMX2_9LACT|nr:MULTISPECIES: CopY/TcrY family copper transport repressor [unclassified Carnobacterium]ALV22625.1 Negative transcriptional regulator-copper transport operon [Carnobacterium sp. CP1]QQP70533.1 CopY/TcrY family copper transport repressor [Carnobacterium sp. CS13]